MGLSRMIANAWRRGGELKRPRPGQVVAAGAFEQWREYPADGLTPSKLIRILRAADQGDAAEALALYEQMEEKDAHLYSVANTRRLALTGLPWEVASAADVRDGLDRRTADQAAVYCREVLAGLDGFEGVLRHLALALGRNIALAECVWETDAGGLRLADLVPVSFDRIGFEATGGVRVLTESQPTEGIAAEGGKFIVHAPLNPSGHPMRGGLLRATALAYLGKHFAMKDWLVFAELFGMPVRVARYEPSATPEEKRELLAMLESLGADAAGIFSKAVELQLLEAGRGTAPPPYERICEFFNRELSKAWLGETLTVDIPRQEVTTLANAPQVHNQVRQDVLADDIVKEGATLRRDLLAPLVELRFGPGVPVPHFRRRTDQARNPRQLAEILSIAVNQLGLQIDERWTRQALGLPVQADAEGNQAR